MSASYEAGFGAAGSASAEQWLHIQRPLPLPPGATDLALTTFDPVTTTKLRVVMQAAPTAGGVGAVQWVVPSIPG